MVGVKAVKAPQDRIEETKAGNVLVEGSWCYKKKVMQVPEVMSGCLQTNKEQEVMAIFLMVSLLLEERKKQVPGDKETGNKDVAALITGCIDIEHLSVGYCSAVVFRQKVKT